MSLFFFCLFLGSEWIGVGGGWDWGENEEEEEKNEEKNRCAFDLILSI